MGAGAIVHLHSAHATALSNLADLTPKSLLAPLKPYVLMRVGIVPLLPSTKPGAGDVVPHIERVAERHAAVLLANHGSVVAGSDLDKAVFAAEEFEVRRNLVLSYEAAK